MSLKRTITAAAILFSSCGILNSQVVINEVSNKNSGQVIDVDNENPDWIEVYNTANTSVNLSDYYLSDDSSEFEKWEFPSIQIGPEAYLLVLASGKNLVPEGSVHWESPVLPNDDFRYIIPDASTPDSWNQSGFSASSWPVGRAGFGYGDNDDSTVVANGTLVVYVRRNFSIPAGFSFIDASLDVDYDDGFVAYLNGTEIARVNIDGTPSYNSVASAGREAQMYTGGKPEKIPIDTVKIRQLLHPGENVFAIEIHNIANSSDLSLIPYFSIKVSDENSLFDRAPVWLFPANSSQLHTNFKIDSDGEKIWLYNKLTRERERVWVKNLNYGWSMGRTPDGADTFGIFINPTPGSSNNTKVYSIEREPEPEFSVPEGFYNSSQLISLSSASSTAEIRYTVNGDEPTSTSTLYDGNPIPVAASKVIRAACFSTANRLPGKPVANTYFINNSGHTVPVISVSTNSTNLYGGSGIFDNWTQEWEKPCYIEYFDENGQKKFEQSSGIQIDGGAGGSRSNEQHSFRLEFNNKLYGEGDVNYPLIPDRPDRMDYKSIYIRNGSNQWLTFPFKDAMECKITGQATHNYYSAFTPVVIYINGSYFGLYEMREKVNDEFFENNYGATVDTTFNLLSLTYYYGMVLRALNGSVDTFTSDYNRFLALNPTATGYLAKADKIIDLDYYTDYIIAQTWIADTDWPFNNIKIVKGDFTDNRWRFVLLDLEWSLNPNGWTNSGFDHIYYMLNYDASVPYLRFWKELMKNPDYKKRFINRYADVMNMYYLPATTNAVAQGIYDASIDEMRAEYLKWGGGSGMVDSRMSTYTAGMNTFLSELTARSVTVRNNIVSNFSLAGKYTVEVGVQPENTGMVQVNSITPQTYPWQGVYFSGVPVTYQAKSVGNYVFDGWVPNSFITDVNNPVVVADVKANGYKFIAKFKIAEPEESVTISEINYFSSVLFPKTDWVELFNYGNNAVDLTGWYIRDDNALHKWTILGSYNLNPGDRLVLASDINEFNKYYPDVQNVMGSFGFGLGSESDSVLLFNDKNELVAGLGYFSKAPWPVGSPELGYTLELINPDGDLNSPDNWFAGCPYGSPGKAWSECDTTLNTPSPEGSGLCIYPNPVSSVLGLRLPMSPSSGNMRVAVYNLMGKELLTEEFTWEPGETRNIEVSGLPEGLYILRGICDDTIYNLRFIKQ